MDQAILARDIAALKAKRRAVVQDQAVPLPRREARRFGGLGKKVGKAIRMATLG